MSDNEEGHDSQKEEEEEVIPKVALTKEVIAQNLSQIAKTYDSSSYAFAKLTVEEKEIEVIGEALMNYVHLRNISLNNNMLTSIAEIKELPHLLSLSATNNQIAAMDIFDDPSKLSFLQIVNLSNNKIKEMGAISLANLQTLNLNDNEIAKVSEFFNGHEGIRILEMRKNKLTNLSGFENMPSLEELYLAENEITTIHGIDNVPSLIKLHLRKNAIVKLDKVPRLPSLEYLNLRENQIESMKEIENLKNLKGLKILNLLANPASDESGDDAKKEILIILDVLSLKKINKDPVAEEDVTEAAEEKKARIEKAEEERLEAERLAKEQEDQENEEKANEEEDDS